MRISIGRCSYYQHQQSRLGVAMNQCTRSQDSKSVGQGSTKIVCLPRACRSGAATQRGGSASRSGRSAPVDRCFWASRSSSESDSSVSVAPGQISRDGVGEERGERNLLADGRSVWFFWRSCSRPWVPRPRAMMPVIQMRQCYFGGVENLMIDRTKHGCYDPIHETSRHILNGI